MAKQTKMLYHCRICSRVIDHSFPFLYTALIYFSRGCMKLNEVRALFSELAQQHWMLNTIDEHTNFFDLGITSAELTTLCTQLGRRINLDVSIFLFYQYPTFNLLTEKITDMCHA